MDAASLAARTHVEHNLAYATALGGRTVVETDAVAVDVGSPAAFLNAVVALDASADVLGIARSLYGERPHSIVDYVGLPDLAGAGYEQTPPMPVMVRPAGAAPYADTGLDVGRVRDAAGLAAFERVVVEGMGIATYAGAPPHAMWGVPILDRPSMRLYLGRLDGRAVACAAAVVLDECVGIFAVATMPDVRRRGYGAAVTSAALDEAAELTAVLTASPLGFGVYSALGFETVGERRAWRTV